MSSSYHPHAFFALVVMSSSICSLLIIFWLICSFFFHPPPSFLHITCVCAFVLWNWKIPVGQIIVAPFSSQPLSLSLCLCISLSLTLSLEGSNATGASEAQERSLGKEEQRAVRLQPSPLRTSSPLSLSLPPILPSLGPLASLPSPHWPAPQIKTSDKKMGSLKKGEKAREREREGSP